jgi:hypothetical protein
MDNNAYENFTLYSGHTIQLKKVHVTQLEHILGEAESKVDKLLAEETFSFEYGDNPELDDIAARIDRRVSDMKSILEYAKGAVKHDASRCFHFLPGNPAETLSSYMLFHYAENSAGADDVVKEALSSQKEYYRSRLAIEIAAQDQSDVEYALMLNNVYTMMEERFTVMQMKSLMLVKSVFSFPESEEDDMR